MNRQAGDLSSRALASSSLSLVRCHQGLLVMDSRMKPLIEPLEAPRGEQSSDRVSEMLKRDAATSDKENAAPPDSKRQRTTNSFCQCGHLLA